MKDTLKYRMWDKRDKKMHFNDFIVTPTGYVAKLFQEENDNEILRFNQYDLDLDKNCELMQCTGLLDRNGNLIYEGDIVRITRKDWLKRSYRMIYIVCWDRTQWQLGYIKTQRPKAQNNRRYDRQYGLSAIVSFECYTPKKYFADCEILGNVFENPEMIEKGVIDELRNPV